MTELPLTSQSFLIQLAGHEVDAWSLFSELYGSAIYKFCIRRGLQASEADDVRQEILVAAERHLRAGCHDPAKGSFRGWIFGVARNQINETVRKRNRMIATGESEFLKLLGEIEAPSSNESGEFEVEYRRQLFQWAAELVRRRVNESSWQAFWKTSIDGESSTGAARELNMTVGAVYTAKCRVIRQLQKLLTNLPDDFLIERVNATSEQYDRIEIPELSDQTGCEECQ